MKKIFGQFLSDILAVIHQTFIIRILTAIFLTIINTIAFINRIQPFHLSYQVCRLIRRFIAILDIHHRIFQRDLLYIFTQFLGTHLKYFHRLYHLLGQYLILCYRQPNIHIFLLPY